jgi:hypothetical protein
MDLILEGIRKASFLILTLDKEVLGIIKKFLGSVLLPVLGVSLGGGEALLPIPLTGTYLSSTITGKRD